MTTSAKDEFGAIRDEIEKQLGALPAGVRVGICDTGLAIAPITSWWPNATIVTIHRMWHQSLKSFMQTVPGMLLGRTYSEDAILRIDEGLDALVAAGLAAKAVPFVRLDALLPDICATIGVAYDATRHQIYKNLYIESIYVKQPAKRR